MSKHYVVKIEVEKVERAIIKAKTSYDSETLGERQVKEIGKVIIKGDSLDDALIRAVDAAQQIKDYE